MDHETIPKIMLLRARLDAIGGVQVELTADQALSVQFKGKHIANWVPDGSGLCGDFGCEGALLCAETADEAAHLTLGRLT